MSGVGAFPSAVFHMRSFLSPVIAAKKVLLLACVCLTKSGSLESESCFSIELVCERIWVVEVGLNTSRRFERETATRPSSFVLMYAIVCLFACLCV